MKFYYTKGFKDGRRFHIATWSSLADAIASTREISGDFERIIVLDVSNPANEQIVYDSANPKRGAGRLY